MINIELYSFDAEEIIIRALLENKLEVLDHVTLDYFTNKHYRAIFKAVKDLTYQHIGIDYSTINQQLKANKLSIPDNLIIEILGNSLPVNIQSNIGILKDLYKRRVAINTLQGAIIDLRTKDTDIDGINSTIASKLDNLTFEDDSEDDNTISIIKRLEADLKSAVDEREQRFKYGLPELDHMTWGLHKEELTTIAAKSGVGKTALVLQIAKNLINNGLKVLIISREMSDIQVLKRILTTDTGIEGNKFRSRSFTQAEWDKITKYLEEMKRNGNLYVNTRVTTVTGIKKRIRQIKPDVVIIDYLQLLSPEKSETSREREVATISREIKGMTSDFKIPIIQLSQLNDEFGDNRPKGERAMRESKAIYHDSNNVIYIHVPNKSEKADLIEKGKLMIDDYRTITDDGNELVEIILDKQRDGMTGSFLQQYIKNRLTFSPIVEKDFYEIKEPKHEQIKLL